MPRRKVNLRKLVELLDKHLSGELCPRGVKGCPHFDPNFMPNYWGGCKMQSIGCINKETTWEKGDASEA